MISPSNNSTTVHTGNTFDWSASYYVDYYEIEIDTSMSFNSTAYQSASKSYMNISSSNSDTEHKFENMYFGTKYYWRVRAINAVDTSAWNTRTFTTVDYVNMIYPSDLATNISTSGTNLDWSASYYVDLYQVEWDTTSSFNSTLLQSATKAYYNNSSSNTDTEQNTGTLLNNKTYFWRVRAINAVDTSKWNNRMFSTGAVVQGLFPPTLISPSNNSTGLSTTVNLVWNSVNNAAGYTVEYSTQSNFSTSQSVSTTNTTIVINSLSSATTYFWRVRATNSTSVSPWSSVWQFTTGGNNCNNPDTPVLVSNATAVCEGSDVTISVQSGDLNDATAWSLYAASCGGTSIASNSSGVFTISPSSSNTYYVRGEEGCVTSSNCGSITISVYPTYLDDEIVSICQGSDYTFPDNTTMTNIQSDLSYTSTMQTVNGCDSVMITNIVVISIDVATSVQNNTITANQAGAQYQWINCDDNQPIVGETSQTFSPQSSGNYAVIVYDNNCSDTSACVNITNVGVEEKLDGLVNVYPNPVADVLFVNTNLTNYFVQIIDVSGKVVFSQKNVSQIDVSGFLKGIYSVKITSSSSYSVRYKVIRM